MKTALATLAAAGLALSATAAQAETVHVTYDDLDLGSIEDLGPGLGRLQFGFTCHGRLCNARSHQSLLVVSYIHTRMYVSYEQEQPISGIPVCAFAPTSRRDV